LGSTSRGRREEREKEKRKGKGKEISLTYEILFPGREEGKGGKEEESPR